jgi:hypothetical protein
MHKRLRLAMGLLSHRFLPTGLIPVDFKSIGNVCTKVEISGLAGVSLPRFGQLCLTGGRSFERVWFE